VVDRAGHGIEAATVLASAVDDEGGATGRPVRCGVATDGSFMLLGAAGAARVRVRASAPGFLPSDTVLIPIGARDVQLSLARAGRFEARLVLDADVPAESVVVDVRTAGGPLRAAFASERVVVDGLPDAPLFVEVRLRQGGWLLERREGLAPRAAAPLELDLRGRLTVLRLRLVGPDGRPLDRVLARVHPAPWPAGDVWVRSGGLEIVVPTDARSITVEPRGYRAVAAAPYEEIQELAFDRR
jgi:hypothetical protein